MRYECHINYDDCDLCNECVECCSGKALTIVNNQIQFQTDKCTNCEVCSDVCPVGAIWIETLDYEELSEMTMNKWFELDAHRIRTVKGKKYIASIFNTEQAERVCDMLNDLITYKMIVRNNKQIIEDINQKSISELKKETYGDVE